MQKVFEFVVQYLKGQLPSFLVQINGKNREFLVLRLEGKFALRLNMIPCEQIFTSLTHTRAFSRWLPFARNCLTVNLVLVRTAKNNYFSLCTNY